MRNKETVTPVKVACYCRVSTDKQDQIHSLAAQQRFFREYVAHHLDWELYDVYADEGITGTSTKKRIQFNRMIRDAYRNQFQLIITKEVSRFSRNVLDTISYTRQLKSLGIGVMFMTDGFCTLDADAELRLSIMGSIAQEESRKTSARVKWGQTRQMERGVVFGRSLLGFHVEHGELRIDPNGAEIVKRIFHKYGIEKKGTTVIARELREEGLLTSAGSTDWNESQILKILKNEKYVGDLVQKKTITPDYLTHEKKSNRGEEKMIVIRDHHDSIIGRELWDTVQEEIAARKRGKNSSARHSTQHTFSGKIICGECGSRFVSRVKRRSDGTSYRVWGCLRAVRNGRKKIDSNGNILGCDIGRQLRDDVANNMLKQIIKEIEMDKGATVKRVVKCAMDAINREDPMREISVLQNEMKKLENKKIQAIDSFLAGEITHEEFEKVRTAYDEKQDSVKLRMRQAERIGECCRVYTEKDIENHLKSILLDGNDGEVFHKLLLESCTVGKDGTVKMKLNHLSTIWCFYIGRGEKCAASTDTDTPSR